MRIRVWSSDVCSSDLPPSSGRSGDRHRAPACRRRSKGRWLRKEPRQAPPATAETATAGGRPAGGAAASSRRAPAARTPGQARKRVGEGKSVAGRVDLGGLSIIKKKKIRNQKHT